MSSKRFTHGWQCLDVVISDKKPHTSEDYVKMYRDEASRYFQENFPGMEINKDILELVGILRQPPGKYDKTYRES